MKASGATSITPCSISRVGLVAQHIEQRVIKRPQIGIDLLFQVAGQKAQPLARFQRRARQDQPLDPALIQHMRAKAAAR